MMIFFLTELVVCVRSVDISMCVCLYSAKKKSRRGRFCSVFFRQRLFPQVRAHFSSAASSFCCLLVQPSSSSSSTSTQKNYYAYNQNSSYQDIVLKEHQKVVPFNAVFIRRDILRSLWSNSSQILTFNFQHFLCNDFLTFFGNAGI